MLCYSTSKESTSRYVNICLSMQKAQETHLIPGSGRSDSDSWGFLVPLLDPQAGKPDVGFITFATVGERLWCYCSSVCGSFPCQRMWEYFFIVIMPLLPSYCGFFVFGCGTSFFWWVPASSC